MSTEVDVGYWWDSYLAPGQQQTWWLTWAFDSSHYVHFDAMPRSDNSEVEVTAQWVKRDIYGNVTRYATVKNRSATQPALFQWVCVQAPNKW
ncbi:MAG: hypothetical protein QNJ44_13070 [Rhodobacter sp.]|nr:hypothetical protein [Rhodobacter sp.]